MRSSGASTSLDPMWMAPALVVVDADPTLSMCAVGVSETLALSEPTGSSTDSGAENPQAGEAPTRATKRTKATYYVRRDEIASLRDQIKSLEAKLTSVRLAAAKNLRGAQLRSLLLERTVERNNLVFAGADGTLSEYKLAVGPSSSIPLHTYIHMPADVDARQRLLEAMRRPKLDAARRFVAARTRSLDVRYEHQSEDVCALPNGDGVCVGCDIMPFTSGHSVKQVFEALASFVMNQEMSISERLGVLTIRENDDLDGLLHGQSRFLSTTPLGVAVESNSVLFASYADANPVDGTRAHAVATVDFVDDDALYPYRPDDCARKEISVALTITETTSESGARVVSLCKWGYTRLRMPRKALSEDEAASARDSVRGFASVMNKVMRERLSTQTPEP